ncbi:hypothetical protein EGW08_009383 [Elysia chlorotica]|uniref:Uncharacterized protein n=1 Tax=Elysia chlorotica TaxID=188477 RepID=A0A433TMV8_ELYCH|nr:hypothetical protein EGW08_009383 [Elysia chlorotica]
MLNEFRQAPCIVKDVHFVFVCFCFFLISVCVWRSQPGRSLHISLSSHLTTRSVPPHLPVIASHNQVGPSTSPCHRISQPGPSLRFHRSIFLARHRPVLSVFRIISLFYFLPLSHIFRLKFSTCR